LDQVEAGYQSTPRQHQSYSICFEKIDWVVNPLELQLATGNPETPVPGVNKGTDQHHDGDE
jgi:hypothetical protein